MVTGCTKSSVAVFALAESTCVRCRQSILYALSIRACDTRWCIHYEWFTRLMVATDRPVTTDCAPLDNVHTAQSEVRFKIPVSSYQSQQHSIQYFPSRWSISTIIVTVSKTVVFLYSNYFYIQNNIVSTEGIRIFLHQKFISREMDYAFRPRSDWNFHFCALAKWFIVPRKLTSLVTWRKKSSLI